MNYYQQAEYDACYIFSMSLLVLVTMRAVPRDAAVLSLSLLLTRTLMQLCVGARADVIVSRLTAVLQIQRTNDSRPA